MLGWNLAKRVVTPTIHIPEMARRHGLAEVISWVTGKLWDRSDSDKHLCLSGGMVF